MIDFERYLSEHHQINLNEQQLQAVKSIRGHTLLLAVPGSGKTTVLVSRIANLILNHHVAPDKILTLTFSRESAHDMKTRFVRLFGNLVEEIPHFSTIHSFCNLVLRTYSKEYRRPMPRLLQDSGIGETRAQILRRIYFDINGEFLAEDMLESLANDISLAKNLMYSEKEIARMSTQVDNFPDIMARYEAIKKKQQLMDFDDMLSHAYVLLCRVAPLRELFLKRYPYVHVDEAQDTSKIQYSILRLFAKTSEVFAVGDEDQCIYSFRGAYPQGLLDFPTHFESTTQLKIEQNYRSNADIVDTANRFIARNKLRYPKQMYCENARDNSILWKELDDYASQCESLKDILKDSPNSQTVAVLYRNNESAIPMLDMLRREGIDYYIKEHNLKFFHGFVVKDILAFFTLAYNPCDLLAFEQIYYKCMCSKAVLQFVQLNITSYDSVFEAAAHMPSMANFQVEKLMRIHRLLSTLSKKRPFSAINLIEQQTGYGEYLSRMNSSSSLNPVNAQLKLGILKTIAKHYQTIEEFAENLVALEQSNKQASTKKDAKLTLSSIHSSKGLEFDTVVLVDMIDSVLPDKSAIEEEEMGYANEMEDCARLFYVAMTRAKTKLIILTSRFCNDEYALPSRFVRQIQAKTPTKTESKAEKIFAVVKGKKVYHKYFGEGIATTDCIEDMLDIYFYKHGTKTLSYSSCVTTQVLEFLE